LKIHFIFHLNLCFSSIEEKEREKVINECYWPLIKIIEKLKIPIGIEASAYTIEEINKIDTKLIKKLKNLIFQGLCDFIGSGYSQLIGPLVPAKINNYNLKIGNQIYHKFLNIKPKTALINEQAFSRGILENYISNGYENVIMDWDNCFKVGNNFKDEYFYFSQKIYTENKKKINLIWSSSIFFQKFQRYIHGEISLNEYLNFIISKKQNFRDYSLCLYASDLEVINFRTKRFKTETKIIYDEWLRFEILIKKLVDKNFHFINPTEVLKIRNKRFGSKFVDLTNPEFPCITKKQSKYNILRWAVTGRDDNKINTICWKIFNKFKLKKEKKLVSWKKLCFLWSSDFRTHITSKRWKKYLLKLNDLKKKNLPSKKNFLQSCYSTNKKNIIFINNSRNSINIKGNNIEIMLNKNKGCVIDKFYDHRVSKEFIFGYVPHGYFKDIVYGVDFYSGHLVIEPLGQFKITDLHKPDIKVKKLNNIVIIECVFKIDKGKIFKKIIFDNYNNRIGIYYKIRLKKNIYGSVRLNHITLNPKIYKKNLYFETNNGGKELEKFLIKKKDFDHGRAISHLISANQAVGATENILYLGDKTKSLKITIDRDFDNQIGMLSYKKIYNQSFFRACFSVKEHDDTTKENKNFESETLIWIKTEL